MNAESKREVTNRSSKNDYLVAACIVLGALAFLVGGIIFISVKGSAMGMAIGVHPNKTIDVTYKNPTVQAYLHPDRVIANTR